MPSPFPGIDPFIESQGRWPDFHSRFLLYCCDQIATRLPEAYVAQMDEQVHLVSTPNEPVSPIRPDIAIFGSPEAGFGGHGPAVATLEPVTVTLEMGYVEEARETRIEIRKLPELSLVTVVELLSPSNKAGLGREDYLHKRMALLKRPVHLVELDLLLGGHRLPMGGPLPPGHAYAIVSRAGRRPESEVYAWTLRDGLPTIPIPLLPPDPDVSLDLAPAFATAYDRGRYARVLRYHEPLATPLGPGYLGWVEELTKP